VHSGRLDIGSPAKRFCVETPNTRAHESILSVEPEVKRRGNPAQKSRVCTALFYRPRDLGIKPSNLKKTDPFYHLPFPSSRNVMLAICPRGHSIDLQNRLKMSRRTHNSQMCCWCSGFRRQTDVPIQGVLILYGATEHVVCTLEVWRCPCCGIAGVNVTRRS